MTIWIFNFKHPLKRRKLREVVHMESLDFLAIQETKMEVISDSLVRCIWGSSDCDWAFIPAVGNSGGILSIWNKVKATLVFSFTGDGFVGVCLDLVAEQKRCYIVNVYVKCNCHAKRKLWDDILMSKMGFGDGLGCVTGDFNSIRDCYERRGMRESLDGVQSSEMAGFEGFLNSLELVDMPLIGRKFTWFHPNGMSMSRLDRLLISPSWFEMWGSPNVWVLPRDVADHCPLVLRYSSADWGPKPFRFNNFWLENRDFKEVITNAWEAQHLEGWMGFILRERLKGLKLVIKDWSQKTYGVEEGKKKQLICEIKALDLKSESLGLVEGEVVERKRLFEELWKILNIKARSRRNKVVALRTQNGWVEGPVQVREEVVRYFRAHFDNVGWQRPNLDGNEFPCLSHDRVEVLTAKFTLEEISDAVKSSDGNKSPGPEGFNFSFIKEFWDLMKHDIRITFDQFHGNSCLPKGLLSYFLALIPKVNSPQALGDFRPISLLGCLYKLVAKVLAARLGKVLGELIPKTQSAFLKGRQLVDGVVVVNEIVDYAKKAGKECLVLKVDFEKAYDSVDWRFLEYMLRRFGFGIKWREWMKACVCSGKMSVLVNGCPTEEISIKRGLKQGDPLAPLLFLIVAEGLGALMRSAVDQGRIKPFVVGRGGMPVSILQYADDTLCIGKASVENLWAIKAVLRGFEMASGLKVNFWKSSIMGVNVSHDFLVMASGFLNCRIGNLPFKYLGLPVGANPRLSTTWAPMLDLLKRRLGKWGNKYISLGGRIVLINSVLSSIPIFFLSYMKMPLKVWREVVRLQRNFLWGGISKTRRISWVRWEDICKPKVEGGLGIRDLRLVHLSLLAKWRRRLLLEEEDVWQNVIKAKYGDRALGNVRLDEGLFGNLCSAWWKDLCRLDKDSGWFSQVAVKRVGMDNTIVFWKDIWVGDQTLEQRFPRLFGISIQQDELEEALEQELKLVIGNIIITEEIDGWVWRPNVAEGFSVKSLYQSLDHMLLTRNLLFLDRIPTKENLCHRAILHNDESLCVACGGAVETSCHLFLHCDFAAAVWYAICRWLGVVLVIPREVLTSYGLMVGSGRNKRIKKGFSIVWLAFIWVIWKTRNDRIFNQIGVSVDEAVNSIQRISWQWFVYRMAKSPCLLYEWAWNPGDCMLR
ncbi:hypothetical protein TSUD_145580 [Trifolium subterraneum]|uniref:Reverse transcriptase domain-containing protein n=1 Tax=Trifolium subterraneum TaxID=3900 RepID=A0A2Z6MJ82_TRISU|nr:hypothetical protein TSUD_145580 [Trifolium subterraneum]